MRRRWIPTGRRSVPRKTTGPRALCNWVSSKNATGCWEDRTLHAGRFPEDKSCHPKAKRSLQCTKAGRSQQLIGKALLCQNGKPIAERQADSSKEGWMTPEKQFGLSFLRKADLSLKMGQPPNPGRHCGPLRAGQVLFVFLREDLSCRSLPRGLELM